jgi:hypothetical protein
VVGSTAASLLSAGLVVAWLLLDTSGSRLVLARGWHGPSFIWRGRLHASLRLPRLMAG